MKFELIKITQIAGMILASKKLFTVFATLKLFSVSILNQVVLIMNIIEMPIILLLIYFATKTSSKLYSFLLISYSLVMILLELSIFRPFELSLENMVYILLLTGGGIILGKEIVKNTNRKR